MRKALSTPLLVYLVSACSVYGAPSGEMAGSAGAAQTTSMTSSAAGAETGGSFDPGGVGGTGTAPEDAGEQESASEEVVDANVGVSADAIDAMTCAGHALQFSGFSYVRINRPVQDDFTLEAWIKTKAASLTGTHHWEGNGLFWADVSWNKDDFGASILNQRLAFGVGTPGSTEPTIQSTSTVVKDQWVHVAVSRARSNGEIKVFVNGMQEASLVVATQLKALTAQMNMTIGADVFDNRFFVGLIDEVRAWNVVRTAAEITATMRQRLVGDEPGLVGYWRFDEGSGMVAADSKVAGADAASEGGVTKNNGDLFGAPNWVASDAPICP